MNHVQKYLTVRQKMLEVLPTMNPAFNRLELAQAMGESAHFFTSGIALDTFKQLQTEGFIENASPRTWSYVAPPEPVEVGGGVEPTPREFTFEEAKVLLRPNLTIKEAMELLFDTVAREVKSQNKNQMQSDMQRQHIIELNEKDEIIESLTKRNVELADKLNDSFIPDLRSLKV